MKKITLVLLLALTIVSLYGQKNSKDKDIFKNEEFFGIIRLGAGMPLTVDYEHGQTTDEISDSSSAIYSLNAVGGYYLVPEFSVGIGFGLDGLHNPSANTFPIYGDLRYYSKDESNTWYGMFNYGRNLKLNNSFKKGELIRLGIGYKFFINKLCCVADMNYGQYDVSIDGEPIRKTQYSYYYYKRVLGFSFGIMF